MILKRYCIDCGKIEPPKDEKCCPDSRVFWIEKDAAERINDLERGRIKTFGSILRERDSFREALENIRDSFITLNDNSHSNTAYAIATEALDPKGCAEMAKASAFNPENP